MSYYKHILIDAPFDGPEYERLMSLKDNPILSTSKDVTLINIYNSNMAAHLPGDIDSKDFDQVEYVIKEKLPPESESDNNNDEDEETSDEPEKQVDELFIYLPNKI